MTIKGYNIDVSDTGSFGCLKGHMLLWTLVNVII